MQMSTAFDERVLPNESKLVDISHLRLACCLGYVDFRYPDTDWSARFPQVAVWYRNISLRPSLARTVPQSPPAALPSAMPNHRDPN
jgi:hypothetical protein